MSSQPTNTHGDEFHTGKGWSEPVYVATTTAGTLASSFEDGDTVDGVTLATGMRILIKDQASGAENGIYVVQASGAPTRSYDFDAAEKVNGRVVYVIAGTTNAGTIWGCTNTTVPVLGTDAITWAEMSGGGSTSFGTPAISYGTPAAGAGSTAIRTDATLAPPDAADVPIADAGSYFTSTDVEGALQELGAAGPFVLADHGGEEVVDSHGSTGSTETIDLASGNWHALTLDADCALTLTGATNGTGCSIIVEVSQDGTGGHALTFPASVANRSDLAAQQDTTASGVSFLILVTRDGGTTWYGFWAGGSAVGALDDLSDVTLTSPAVADRIRYDGSVWRNSALIWRPVTTYDGANWLPAVDGSGNAIMVEG